MKNTLRIDKVVKKVWTVIRGVIVLGICFIIIYPIIVKLSVSFMQEKDIYDITVRYFPKNFTLDNYRLVWTYMDYPIAFLNSLKLALTTSTLQLISCTLIGYGFARFKFKGKNLFFGLVIATLVIPDQTIMIPLYLHFRYFDIFGLLTIGRELRGINLLDTMWPFVLLSATGMGLKNGLYIFILRQFFRGMPKELEEAAYVDGAGNLRTFGTIMLPSAVPIMVTVFLFSFVWQWNDTFYSTLYLSNLKVLPAALSSLANNISLANYWDLGMRADISPFYFSMINNTGSLLMVVPLVMLYLFAQRYFVQSIERSGIVG